MRDFWRSRDGLLGEFATRFSGSSDLYGGVAAAAHRLGQPRSPCTTASPCATWSPTTPNTTRPTARPTGTAPTTTAPGTAGSRARPTTPTVVALRARQSRALLTTLLLSFGVPLLLGGDELGRTQGGNNNAYCQDNEITWFDWSSVDERPARLHPAPDRAAPRPSGVPPTSLPRRGRGGRARAGSPRPATPMTDDDWGDPSARGAWPSTSTATTHPDLARTARLLRRRRLPRAGQRLVGEAPVPGPRHRRAPGLAHRTGHLRPAGERPTRADLHAGDDLTLGPGSILVLQAAPAGS